MEKGFMQYDSIDMARHIITECKERDINDVCNTKINKLLYCVYGVYLALYDNEILTEQPKYFPYGPVFPRVLKEYDELVKQPIKLELDDNLKEIINIVLNTFGKASAAKLSVWSHQKNSPWDKMKQKEAKYSDPLNPLDVRDYFRKIIHINESKE